MPATELPIVDFSLLNIDKVKPEELSQLRENGSLIQLAKELVGRLQEYGFCYLKHPGSLESKVNKMLGSLREVFLLPEERKKDYARRDNVLIHGYGNRGIERPDQVTSVERYETFMICESKASCWPDEVPDFKPESLAVYKDVQELSFRVFDLLGIGLELDDPSFFRRSHGEGLGELRPTVYYSYPDHFVPKPGQMRFFEHCDMGTVALIYQDSERGLQVKSRSGDWLDAEVIPDTVILMVGQLFQRWTSGKIRAPLHRVMIPADEESRRKDRFSMTFFPLTPDDFIIEGVDGSNTYPAISVADVLKRLEEGDFSEI